MSPHIISPSAVCSCDPCLWKGRGAVPACVSMWEGMLWDGIIVGFMFFKKIPSPCFHGNPSISVNPGDSEQASNHSRPRRWCSLTWLKTTFSLVCLQKIHPFPVAQNEVNRKQNFDASFFDHMPNSCLYSQVWLNDAWKLNAVQWWFSERKLAMTWTWIYRMKITDASASPVKVRHYSTHLNGTTKLSSTTNNGNYN